MKIEATVTQGPERTCKQRGENPERKSQYGPEVLLSLMLDPPRPRLCMDLEPGQPKPLTAASPRVQHASSALQVHVSICEPLVDAAGAVCTWYVGGTHGPRRAGVLDRADLRARASHGPGARAQPSRIA